MFYRPHFCCHCGEKIVRANWTPLTSRRFCEFCAVEQKQHDLLPRAAAVTLLLFGAAGFTAYLGGGNASPAKDAAASVKAREQRIERIEKSKALDSSNEGQASVSLHPRPIAPTGHPSNTEQRDSQRNSSTEPVYYCGAMTKKGTACTRRVKAPGRCWQHPGQRAMSPVRN